MNDNFNTRMILTTAVFAAVAALLVGPASAKVWDLEGGGGNGTQVTMQPPFQPGTVEQLDPAIRTAIAARESVQNVQRTLTEKGPIPYLSHGIGVDQSLYQGEQQQSLGLTGDSPITRVVGQEPAGLTGDSPRTRGGQIFQANATSLSSDDSDVNWTWVGFATGMAALAAMGALYLSARHRDRVALP